MLITILPFFSNETKCNQFLQKLDFLHSSLVFTHEKKLKIYFRFLLRWSKSLTKSFLLQFIESPHLRDSIYAEILLDKKRGKLVLLALFFTELLKFALQKSSRVKSAKSKISCDRMDTHKKSLFLELKR